ncbi:subtilisin family serine protease [Geomicrobium halophilum]|uniref:Subtilisin family serine protease n=1 Tax=Geomicrobium halophilum TaxID=549000 RepID=A0A841Q2T4_9BACL|nr:S8 family peptidase [Geomicrobium halophilum]MBB6451418.1 subtilisin family serine protease [Geomicrobium halophilum]
MKKSLVWLVLLSFAVPTTLAHGSDEVDNTRSSDGDNYIEGELIFSVENKEMGIQSDLMMQVDELEEEGFEVVDSLLGDRDSHSIQTSNNDFQENVVDNMGFVYLTEYSQADYDSIEEAKTELEDTLTELGLEVRDVSENYEMYATDVTTEQHPNQEWHYEMINAPDAWEVTPGSNEVTHAVLDTGIDDTHESLGDYVDTNLGRSFVGDGTTMDRQGHGTHVAGTIASYGSVSGVMQEASLVPVKVLGDDGTGSMFGIIEGVLYAADIGVDVINMSLGGGGYNQIFDEAVQTAVDEDSIVIAASGNEYRSSISYPAAYDSVIAVGSVDSDGTRSSFSNYGNGLEVMAPGSNIYSTLPNNRYGTLSGTSMAAPHVAGVAGLMRSVDSNLSVSEARSIMNDTAQEAGNEFEYGNGIVDALAAVQAVD